MRADAGTAAASGPLALFRLPLAKSDTARLTSLLTRDVYPYMRRLMYPIPASAISEMTKNYSEKLPKTMRLRTAFLSTPRGKSFQAARSLGVVDLLKSEAVRRLAERIAGKRLNGDPGIQIICYEAGDYSGPHNDHHPEEPHLRDGYIDVHYMLPEADVRSQLLVYESKDGVLNRVEEVGRQPGLAVYQLPFWHYTTPLEVRRNSPVAKRWLLLASFEIEHSG